MTQDVLSEEKLPVLEELTSNGEGSGLEVESITKDGGSINVPFDPAKIDVITQARTVDLLLTRLKEGELDLSPDFQRRANLWNDVRKSSLIESMLLKIPIPSLYVSEDRDGNYAVVDGLQRLCAIAHFVNVTALNSAVNLDKRSRLNPLRLKDLQSLREYIDVSYDELPRPLQRRIKETELTLHIIRASTPNEVKFNIFSRINQGGLPLTAQEIRNAIYPGAWRTWTHRLAESNSFLKATEKKIKGERMEDLELVLRFVALCSMRPDEKKRPADQNLDDFLNHAVEKRFADWNEDRWKDIERLFNRSLDAATKIFGRIAFRKYSSPDGARLPINRGLFETETVALANFNEDELNKLAANSSRVIEKFHSYFNEDKEFSNALLYATGKGSASNKRLEKMEKIFKDVIND